MSAHARFRPFSRAMALEPRILFDGAAAVAGADALGDDPHRDDPASEYQPASDAGGGDGQGAILLVVDARVVDYESLLTDLPANVQVRVVDRDESGVGAVGAALANGSQRYEAVHILSHGEPGSVTLGTDTLNLDTLSSHTAQLQGWAAHLTADADILLYGCDVAASLEGRLLINELAMWTGADVAASTDPTGAEHLGGDWNLGAWTGQIEAGLPFGMEAMRGYGALLDAVDPASGPSVAIELPATGVMIGETFTFDLVFENNATYTGYGPYIDLYLPLGADAGVAGVPIADQADGIRINDVAGAITYLGEPVEFDILTLDASGKALHPYAKDATGAPHEISGVPGQQVVVIELPFGSFTPDQPAITLQVEATVHRFADQGTPLALTAVAGFRYGKTAVEDYADDPSIWVDPTSVLSVEVEPQLVRYEYLFSGPEGETATGPNFTRTMTTEIYVAPGQVLTDYEVTVDGPDYIVVQEVRLGGDPLTLGSGSAPASGEYVVGADGSIRVHAGTLAGSAAGSAAARVVVEYYVPEFVSPGGANILDAQNGIAGTAIFNVSGVGQWQPLDTRDAQQAVVNNDTTQDELTHEINSLAVQKTATVVGGVVKPGAMVDYTLNFQVSDYFRFGDVFIIDTIKDGHLQGVGAPTLTLHHQGEPVLGLGASHNWYTDTYDSATGETTRVMNVSLALRNAGLPGDLGNGVLTGGRFDGETAGGTYGTITYSAQVNDKFVGSVPAGADKVVNHGDLIETTASIRGTVVPVSGAGQEVVEDTQTAVSVDAGVLALNITQVNGSDVGANVSVNPGDTVTYELTYDLQTGDFEKLVLDAYLPKPVVIVPDAAGWGSNLGTDSSPAQNRWTAILLDDDGNLISDWKGANPQLSVADNKLSFAFGDRDDVSNQPAKVVVRFTAVVNDEPFADNLFLTAQAQSSDKNTQQVADDQQAIGKIRLNEPKLEVRHGIVATSNGDLGNELLTAPGWMPWNIMPGSPFVGTVTDINAVDFDLTGADAGDRVRFAAAIANTGGAGAYDVTTTDITAPTGFKLVTASGADATTLADANLKVYRGNGTALVAGTDYTISGGVITLIDHGDADSDGRTDPGLAKGRNGDTPVSDGSNILIITYDAEAVQTIVAGSVTSSTVGVQSYWGVDNGAPTHDFLPGVQVVTDSATATIAAPTVKIVFKDGTITGDDSSAPHTTGSDVVVGESMVYDIVVTLPEGETHDLKIDAMLPPGLLLDKTFNGNTGYQLITQVADSAALSHNFNGAITSPTLSNDTGNPGDDPRFSFAMVTTTGENSLGNNSFVIRVQAIVANVATNDRGTPLDTSTRLYYDRGGLDNNTLVNQTGEDARVTVREPQLTITKTVDTDLDTTGTQTDPIDAGDDVQYTITIANGNGTNDYDAFDLIFSDAFHSVLTPDTNPTGWTAERVLVGGARQDLSGFFEWDGNEFKTIDNANLDLLKGEQIVLTVKATSNAGAAAVSEFDSQAVVQWSSINSTNNDTAIRAPHERHGDDGLWDETGVLNDYRARANAPVEVVANYQLSRVGGMPGTVMPADTQDAATQAVGEIVRFRVVAQIPEGDINGLVFEPVLPAGYQYLGNATVAFVSDTGMTSTTVNGAAMGDGDSSVWANIDGALDNSNTTSVTGRPGTGITAEVSGNRHYFDLGNVRNTDNDPDAEYVVIEFNAVVANVASNVAGAELETKVVVRHGGIDGTVLNETNTVTDTVIEPSLVGLQKDVVDMSSSVVDGKRVVTVRNTFESESGTNRGTAYEVTLKDAFPGGDSYAFKQITVGSTTYSSVGELADAGISFSQDADGVTFVIKELAAGTEVVLEYTVAVPVATAQAALPATAAELVWSSLPDGVGSISQTGFAGATVGADGAAGGERIGLPTDTLNNYRLTDNAGYGVISGVLWDDTKNRDGVVDAAADEPRLANAEVTLTWAGLDGLFGTGDDVETTVTTDANGAFSFGGLPVGKYRIVGPGTVEYTYGTAPNADTDLLTPRWDADSNSAFGTIELTLTEGATQASQNIGYLRVNDAPSFTGVGGSVDYTEGQNTDSDTAVVGTPVRLTGEVTVNDPELVNQGLDNFDGTTLRVSRSDVALTGFDPVATDVLAIKAGTAHGLDVTINASQVMIGGMVVGTHSSTGGMLTVTFNATATSADVNAVASLITYTTTSHTPGTSAVIRYRFNDANDDSKQGSGGALAGDATVTVNITAVNDPPVATDDANGLTNLQDTVTGNVRTGVHQVPDTTTDKPAPYQPDSDPDTPLTDLVVSHIRVTTPGETSTLVPVDDDIAGIEVVGKYGTLTIHPDGSYSYELDRTNSTVYGLAKDAQLTETFEYTLSDEHASEKGTDTATLTITVTGAEPEAPTIVPTDHNGPGATGHATVYESGLPDGTDAAADTETVSGTIKVTADSGLKSLVITGVDPLNPTTLLPAQLDAATPQAPIVITGEHGTLYITGWTVAQGQDSAPREGTLSYTYTLTERVGNVAPIPDAGQTDDFGLKVVDVLDVEATGTLNIYIVDDVPMASADVNSVTKHAGQVTGNIFAGTGTDLTGRDTIGADGPAASGGIDTPVTHVVAGTGTPGAGHEVNPLVPVAGAYGTLTLNPDGSYTYVVDPANAAVIALTGADTPLVEVFTYTITDADGDTATTTLTIDILGNTPPVANPDVRTTPEDTPISGNVITGSGSGDVPDTDVESDPLTLTQFVVDGQTIVVPPGSTGTAVIPGAGTIVMRSDGSYTFNPVPDWHGSVPTITYTVADDKGGEAETTLSITVTPVPDAVPDTTTTLVDVPVVVDPLANDSFEGSDPVVTVGPGDGPSNGTVTVHPNGTITYTPEQGYVGEDTFTYTVTSGGRTETATVTITVTNLPPVPLPDVNTVPEDTPATGNVLVNDSDPDGHPVTVTGFTVEGQDYPPGATVDIPGVGTITLGGDGSYTFVPVPDWHGNVPPIGYTVTDGKGEHASSTLTIVVTPVPDAVPDTTTTLVDVPVTITPLDNDDFEGDDPVLSVVPGDGPSNGTVTVHPDGSITYTPEPGFVGEDTFTYTVTSGGVTETSTVTITVHNQPPVALPDVNTVPEDTPATGNLLVNDHDPDGHPVTVTGITVQGQDYPPGSTVEIPGVGTITVDEDGSYTFIPVPDWHGDVPPIGYTVTDGKGGTATSTLTITVTPVPDAVDDRVTTPGEPVTLTPLDNDSFEGDDPVVSVQPGDGPGRGTVTVEPDGRITYTPEPGFSGEDTFTYTVTSGGVTETATVTVVVTPVATPPAPPAAPPDASWTPPSQPSPEPWAPLAVRAAIDAHRQVAQSQQQARSPVVGDQVRDASVFFDGGVFSKMPRMDMPFHPIVYVNREVQNAQAQRAADDARQSGNPAFLLPVDIESRSIGSGLGMDPSLFVQHMVRMSQQRSLEQTRLVDGRYGRLGLGSDGYLPVPSLFESRLAAVLREQAQARGEAASNDAPGDGESPAPEAADTAAQVSLADVPGVAAQAAPGFTDQLRGGASQLPGAVLAAVPPKVS